MRVKRIFILICILGSVICEEKEEELRKAGIGAPKHRDKTLIANYERNLYKDEILSSKVDFINERRIESAIRKRSTNNHKFQQSLNNLTIGVPPESSHQSTSVNLSTDNDVKLMDRKRGKNTSSKNSTKHPDGICPSIDIRNTVHDFNRIEDCVIIEGFLQIVLIDHPNETSFENVTFPKLREITGYLLFYRVSDLKSLTNLFPNLEVIRGQILITDYAFMVYEMRNLQEVRNPSFITIIIIIFIQIKYKKFHIRN